MCVQAPLVLLSALLPCAAFSVDPGPTGGQEESVEEVLEDEDFAEFDLEDLMKMNIEVTSVSRKAESLRRSAAAVYVLTEEDIRRSGATSIMEALRMVPGLVVARINSNSYAISSRGFNTEFANKMLVLIDGRTVYTSLFSGVFWSQQGVMLEDLDRIEVIRGPGAALWGANAVNGVINVITKTAAETQGGLISTLVGTEDEGVVSFRYGSTTERGHYRVFGRFLSRDSQGDSVSGIEDDWESGRVGFRSDWTVERDSWTVQGDFYRTTQNREWEQITTTPPFELRTPWGGKNAGGNLLARWTRDLEGDGGLSVQAYIDRAELRTNLISEDRDNFDFELQHRISLSERNDFVWGVGYRYTGFDVSGRPGFEFNPSTSHDELFSVFVHDEYQVVPDELSVTFGAKYEHNDYSGDEFQPNVRLSWYPNEETTLWASVSRAVRTPAQINHDLSLNLTHNPPTVALPVDVIFVLQGNEDFESEELTAFELGYRKILGEELSIDLAFFFNDYENLATQEPAGAPIPISASSVLQPVAFDNLGEGETYGLELAAQWSPALDVEIHMGYSLLRMELETKSPITGSLLSEDPDDNPRHQANLRVFYDWNEKTELDMALYYVNHLAGEVDSYIRTDLRLGRALTDNTMLSLGVMGLFHDEEREAAPQALGGTVDVQAAVYISLTTTF